MPAPTAASADLPLVDLRSDTVTRPSPGMRAAIAAAEVGDDALGDDPTTRRLEERVAELLGKERALLFPSGIMANQTALAVLGRWGGEVVVEAGAHVLHFEGGAAAALSGLQLRAVPTPDGLLTAELVRGALRSGSPHQPKTCAVEVENTHVDSGGRVMPLATMEAIAAVAAERELPLHLDGARLWNACAATGHPPSDFARPATTVMVSLSKGLGCPIGSVLAGPAALMEGAWTVRRRLGGAMRQSGILAAAGLYALDHHLGTLPDDHALARRLAEGLAELPAFEVALPETNVVLIGLRAPDRLADLLCFLEMHRILVLKFGPSRLRAVTHRDVDGAGIARALSTFRSWAGAEGRE